jgi:geranylgeranyl pyrophosphate synthase
MDVIYRKTAGCSTGAQIGAILADQTRAVEESLVDYGVNWAWPFSW